MHSVKLFLLAACAAALQTSATSALAATETYSIDPHHSTIGFKVKHLFSYVTGRFDTVEGTLSIDPEKPEASSVNVTIQATTVDTANAKRDTHLKSADFFEVTKFPLLTYVSTSVKQTGADTADVMGNLTLHGVTKEVPLKVHFIGKGPGPQGETRSGWEATASLKRSEFGLTWSKVVEGAQLVGDEVAITLEIEAIKKP